MAGQLVAAARRLPVERHFERHRLHRQLEIQAYARLLPQRTAALPGPAGAPWRERAVPRQQKGVAS